MFDEGTGSPIVFIPGIQGRWEWMAPALHQIAKRCRTISYSLRGRTFDELIAEVDATLDRAQLRGAAICGVSFGGMVAMQYAALRPERATALIIVSTPGPGWRPSPTQARYIAKPWISTPAFVGTAWSRLGPEIKAAIDGWPERIAFCAQYGLRIATAPSVPPQMAARSTLCHEIDLSAACTRITAPALVITGEPQLDRVVPTESTRRYTHLIKRAKYVMIERTGHNGLITRPDYFAQIVSEFVNANRS